jgi:hypothetical protein
MLKKWIGLLFVVQLAVLGQDRDGDEQRTRSSDGTRDVVELKGNKSQHYVEHLLSQDKELQAAVDLLRQKGYAPRHSYVVYTERTGRGVPRDHIEGEVVLWSWEDYDNNSVTGILYARQSESGNSEVNVVQMDLTGATRWRWVTQKNGKESRSEFYGPVQALPAKFKMDHTQPMKMLVQMPDLDFRSYYACASWGCGASALASFLFANPAIFAGGCTTTLIVCLQRL